MYSFYLFRIEKFDLIGDPSAFIFVNIINENFY